MDLAKIHDVVTEVLPLYKDAWSEWLTALGDSSNREVHRQGQSLRIHYCNALNVDFIDGHTFADFRNRIEPRRHILFMHKSTPNWSQYV